MDRCALAFNYRKEKYNCAQAVAAPFADLLGTTPDELAAAMSGFGGGTPLPWDRPSCARPDPPGQHAAG